MGRGADGAVGTGGAIACGAEEAGSTGVGAATLLLVCSYTDAELLAHRPKGSKGRGVHALRLDARDGTLTELGVSDLGGVPNPAFLVRHPTLPDVLYASTECINTDGEVLTLRIGPSGALTVVARRSACGKSTCYVNVHHSREYMLAVSYWDAKVACFPLDTSTGLPCEPTEVLMQPKAKYVEEAKPNRDEHWQFRQRWPHSHCVVTEPYDRRLHFVTDLGLDKVFCYELDTSNGKLVLKAEVALPPGRGPRHLLFHPRVRTAYVVNELDSTVSALTFTAKEYGPIPEAENSDDPAATLSQLCTLSTLPEDFQGRGFITPGGAWKAESHTSELRLSPDGKFLYVGNRGHDSIAVFAVDEAAGGALSMVAVTPSGGRTPRNFNFDASGRYLIVGNQDSDNMSVFKRDAELGTIELIHQVALPSPNYVYAQPLLS